MFKAIKAGDIFAGLIGVNLGMQQIKIETDIAPNNTDDEVHLPNEDPNNWASSYKVEEKTSAFAGLRADLRIGYKRVFAGIGYGLDFGNENVRTTVKASYETSKTKIIHSLRSTLTIII